MELLYKITFVTILCLFSIKILKNKFPEIASLVVNCCFIICIFMPVFILTPISINISPPTSYIIENQGVSIVDSQQIKQVKHVKIPMTKNDEPVEIKTANKTLLLMLWFLGFVLMLILKSSQFILLLSMVFDKNNVFRKKIDIPRVNRKKIFVIINNSAQVPFLFVMNKIYIVLPKQALTWSKSHIEVIIKHEMCHYQRKDHWSLWLSTITISIFWFHPLICLLKNKQNELIELACDKNLIEMKINKHDYAQSLLRTITNKPQYSIVPQMKLAKNQVRLRLNAILNAQYKPTKLFHKMHVLFFILLSVLSGCLVVNDSLMDMVTDEVTLLGNEIPPLRNTNIEKGQIILSAFYDGENRENTFIYFEFNIDNKSKWLKLGPLEKFNEKIHTWHFSMDEKAELTGKYKVTGVTEDGMIDGVAIGMIISNHFNEVVVNQSHMKVNGQLPSLICSWPLDLHDDDLLKVLPLNSDKKLDSVKRLLCGAQLVGNGEYYF